MSTLNSGERDFNEASSEGDRAERIVRAVELAENSNVKCQAISIRELVSSRWRFERGEISTQQMVDTRRGFEAANGEISDEYYCLSFRGGVVLVYLPNEKIYRIHLDYDPAVVAKTASEFEQILCLARAQERNSGIRLKSKPLSVAVKEIFTIVVYLMRTLDGVAARNESIPRSDYTNSYRIDEAMKMAKRELDKVQQFVERTAEHASLNQYFVGILCGFVVVVILMWATRLLDFVARDLPDPVTWRPYLVEIKYFLAICLLGGSIGGLLSVLARITLGRKVRVDTNQSRAFCITLGAARPVVGALFGVAIYVLVKGGVIPFITPPGNRIGVFFFVGLSIISGFSERWAQDTIVRSAPRVSKNEVASQEDRLAPRSSEDVVSGPEL